MAIYGSGANLTNLPASIPSGVGIVGSYVFAGKTSNFTIGATVSGSNLKKGRVTSGFELDDDAALSGTWRRMGGDQNNATAVTLFVRIS